MILVSSRQFGGVCVAVQFPVPATDFSGIVPHQPPMVWVDEVVSADRDHGECRVRLKADALYFDQNTLLVGAGIEWIAQTYAYSRTAYFADQNLPQPDVQQAFLVAVRKAQILVQPTDPELLGAESLLVRVNQFRTMGPLTMFDGEVFLPSGRTMMKAHLRVYQS